MIFLRTREFDFVDWTQTQIEGEAEESILNLLAAALSGLGWEVQYARGNEDWITLGDEDASAA